MKVVVVTRHLPPKTDGVGDYTYQLSLALAKAGLQMVLLTSIGTAPEKHPLLEIQPAVKDWGWGGVFRMVSAVRKLKPDLFCLQYVPHLYSRFGFNLAAASLPLMVRLATGCPVITTCHELLGHHPRGLKAWTLQGAYLFQAWLLLGGSAAVIVPVVWQEAQLRRLFRRLSRKVRRIPVGPSIPMDAAKPPSISRPGSNNSREIMLGTFGTGPWWQHAMAMEVLSGLRATGLQVRLLCLGDLENAQPRYYQRLRALEMRLGLQGAVDWAGRRSSEELSQALRSVDVFLALHETGITGRSTSLATALAHGLPIVATRGPDADPWLLESGAVLAVDPHDVQAAIRSIRLLIDDPSARQALSQRAREVYALYCSWKTISRQFLEVVESLRQEGMMGRRAG